ncbi:MAG: YchJ family metal-binding protein [Polyangiaceae bacterium]
MSATRAPKRTGPCPCQSSRPYGECCKPYHDGAEPPDAERLMRSRFTAFAIGDVAYLARTLDPEHADRAVGDDALLEALRRSCRENRYMGLTICEVEELDPELAAVRFVARVFRKGRDVSFEERSLFRRTESGWRYWRGELDRS